MDLLDGLPESDRPPKSAARHLAKAGASMKVLRNRQNSVEKQGEAQRDEVDNINQLPLTFNNCHFHLDGTKDVVEETKGKQTINNLLVERMSKIGVNNRQSVPPHSMSRESCQSSPSRMSMSELNYGNNPTHHLNSHLDIDYSDAILTEPSDYIRQGMEREKQVLETVHSELRDLSRDLKVTYIYSSL